MKRIQSFTLAETLITLAIIGVVASITIPSLMQKTQDMELKNAWKKEYSAIQNAFNLIQQENGGSIKGLCSDNYCFTKLFKDKLNVQKFCPSNPRVDCYISTNKVKNLSGSTDNNLIGFISAGMILADGSFVAPYYRATDCDFAAHGSFQLYCGTVIVDVNGIKPPNTQGKDLFWIFVAENKIWPAGIVGDDAYNDRTDHSCGTNNPDAVYSGMGRSALYLMD